MLAILSTLKIHNLALVEELTWDLQAGFTTITGETGAGKSLIIGALQLLMGIRADRSLVRHGASSAILEAIFEVSEDEELNLFLEEQGANQCEEQQLILRRQLPIEGTGRQFINGAAVPLSLLRKLGEQLIDLHGPHDHQSLFQSKTQTILLDHFAQATDLRLQYQSCRKAWLQLLEEKETLLEQDRSSGTRELLEEQLAEIEAAHLEDLNEVELLQRHRAASNSQLLLEKGHQLGQLLEGDTPTLESFLTESLRISGEMERLDPQSQQLLSHLEQMSDQFQELRSDLHHYIQDIDLQEEELQQLEEKIDQLHTLKRKYGEHLEDILEKEKELRQRLNTLSGREERLAKIEEEITTAQASLEESAKKLTAKRQSAITPLSAAIIEKMSALGFLQAHFEVKWLSTTQDSSALGATMGVMGAEEAEFLLAPNPGEPPQPLRMIASSGEVSRIMLALKSAIARQDAVPILIFDEIDANVGGAIATRVGQTMRELGNHHQVLCITHLPQVAALAQHHYAVYKELSEGRTNTRFEELVGEERENEIARMLGGDTPAIRAHAQQLLT